LALPGCRFEIEQAGIAEILMDTAGARPKIRLIERAGDFAF